MSASYVNALSELEDFEDGEKPWCDLVFDLVEHSITGKRRLLGGDDRVLSGKALANGSRDVIGFSFQSAPVNQWDEQVRDGVSLSWGQVTLRSIGAPTDALLREYEMWWELPPSGREAVRELTCLAVILGGQARQIFEAETHIKLFFDPHLLLGLGPDQVRDDLYGELFLRVDVPSLRVALSEKDPDYRAPVARWLSGSPLEAGAAA